MTVLCDKIPSYIWISGKQCSFLVYSLPLWTVCHIFLSNFPMNSPTYTYKFKIIESYLLLLVVVFLFCICTLRFHLLFKKLHGVLWYGHTIIYLFKCSLMPVWIINSLSSLQRVVLHISLHTYLCVYLKYEVLGLELWWKRTHLESRFLKCLHKGDHFKLHQRSFEFPSLHIAKLWLL